MDRSPEEKAQFLKAAIQEDRTEIRLIRSRIYNLCTFVTVSSFAVTSFLIGYRDGLAISKWLLYPGLEFSFSIILWVVFCFLKRDLRYARVWLEQREDMVRKYLEGGDVEEPIYGEVDPARKPRICENGLYWIPSLATFALAFKVLVVCFGLP